MWVGNWDISKIISRLISGAQGLRFLQTPTPVKRTPPNFSRNRTRSGVVENGSRRIIVAALVGKSNRVFAHEGWG